MSEPTFRQMAVAVDGSAFADLALDYSISLARSCSSELVVLSVTPLTRDVAYGSTSYIPPEAWEDDTAKYREIAERAAGRARSAGIASVAMECLHGAVAEAILSYLEAHPVDLLVVGSRGLSLGKRLLLGSVSDALVHHATCAVLVIRPEAHSSDRKC